MTHMEAIYYDPLKAGNYRGVHPLARASGASEREVGNGLVSQDAYTLHKPP